MSSNGKPHRPWLVLIFGIVAAACIFACLVIAAVAFTERAAELNDHIYEQCVTDQVQNSIVRSQLVAAKRRVSTSLPPTSAERFYQLGQLNDGIGAIDELNSFDCPTPEGVTP